MILKFLGKDVERFIVESPYCLVPYIDLFLLTFYCVLPQLNGYLEVSDQKVFILINIPLRNTVAIKETVVPIFFFFQSHIFM